VIANVLTIAGTDPSGGAGLQADLKTFSALGVYGMSAITAVVAQNTQGVRSFKTLDTAFVADQIDAVFEDVTVHAVKIGMLATVELANVVADRLNHWKPSIIVLDPVMAAKSGDPLLSPDTIRAIRDRLVPMSSIITPNLPEAGLLLGRPAPSSLEAMRDMLGSLSELGSPWVLLKGGHLNSPMSTDLLYGQGQTIDLPAPRLATTHLHGTGCTLAAAVAALLTRMEMVEAVRQAKAYLHASLAAADQLDVGKGKGPVHHFHALWK
jgi:hydroxymethylpyrimidine/phosphomethylpyrimidine kinase